MVAGLDGCREKEGTALQVYHQERVLVCAMGYEYKRDVLLSPFSIPTPVLTGRISHFLSLFSPSFSNIAHGPKNPPLANG